MAKRNNSSNSSSSKGENFQPADKVVGYFRDSGGDNQDRSVEEQRAEWLNSCKNLSLVPFKEFTDSAKSGRKTRNRHAFHSMIDYFTTGQARQDGVAGLLLWSFSRFAREQDDFNFYISSIRRAGYVVKSITDQIPEGSIGRFYESLVAWKDAMYIADLQKSVKRGQELVLRNYHPAGQEGLYRLPSGDMVQLSAGGFPPLGYEKFSIETGRNRRGEPRFNSYWRKTTDKDLAAKVRLAWELALQGASYSQIEQKCRFNYSNSSYSAMFRTLTYTGVYSYGDFYRQGAFEAYVTGEEFDRVQEILDGQQEVAGLKIATIKHPSMQKYLLGGLVTCGKCGQPSHGSDFTRKADGKKRLNDSQLFYYECSSRTKRLACSAVSKRIKVEELEKQVLTALLEYLDPAKIRELAARFAAMERALNVSQHTQSGQVASAVEELQVVIRTEQTKIKSYLAQLATGEAARLGVGSEVKELMKEASQKRDAAQDKITLLTKAQNKRDYWQQLESQQINEERLVIAHKLLKSVLSLGKPSAAVYPDERIEAAHELLSAIGVEVTLYPDEEMIAQAIGNQLEPAQEQKKSTSLVEGNFAVSFVLGSLFDTPASLENSSLKSVLGNKSMHPEGFLQYPRQSERIVIVKHLPQLSATKRKRGPDLQPRKYKATK